MIKKRLGEPLAGTYRPEFVKRYPALADIVTVGSSSIGRLL